MSIIHSCMVDKIYTVRHMLAWRVVYTYIYACMYSLLHLECHVISRFENGEMTLPHNVYLFVNHT